MIWIFEVPPNTLDFEQVLWLVVIQCPKVDVLPVILIVNMHWGVIDSVYAMSINMSHEIHHIELPPNICSPSPFCTPLTDPVTTF